MEPIEERRTLRTNALANVIKALDFLDAADTATSDEWAIYYHARAQVHATIAVAIAQDKTAAAIRAETKAAQG
jgi:hypothetical protein